MVYGKDRVGTNTHMVEIKTLACIKFGKFSLVAKIVLSGKSLIVFENTRKETS